MRHIWAEVVGAFCIPRPTGRIEPDPATGFEASCGPLFFWRPVELLEFVQGFVVLLQLPVEQPACLRSSYNVAGHVGERN